MHKRKRKKEEQKKTMLSVWKANITLLSTHP